MKKDRDNQKMLLTFDFFDKIKKEMDQEASIKLTYHLAKYHKKKERKRKIKAELDEKNKGKNKYKPKPKKATTTAVPPAGKPGAV